MYWSLVAVGITIGIALTLASGRFIQPLLFGTSAREPVVLAGAAVALATVALLAMLVPTWRATRVDPIVALRAD